MGEIYTSDNNKITEVQRNYSYFPFAWIERHANGHSYLICGENYQGQTIIELDTGKRINYVPDSASQGAGFCWAGAYPSPDGNLVAVYGCYWGASYEVKMYDFSDPLNPPWKELAVDQYADGVKSWIDNDSCTLLRSYEKCIPFNKPRCDLTDEEEKEFCKMYDNDNDEDKLIEIEDEPFIWRKQSRRAKI